MELSLLLIRDSGSAFQVCAGCKVPSLTERTKFLHFCTSGSLGGLGGTPGVGGLRGGGRGESDFWEVLDGFTTGGGG